MNNESKSGSVDPVFDFGIEVRNLGGELYISWSAEQREVEEIVTAGDVRKNEKFRRAFTNKVLGHTDELELYPMHLISIMLDDVLPDSYVLEKPSLEDEEDGVLRLHAI